LELDNKKVPEEVEVILEGLDEDNINSLLAKWLELDSVKSNVNKLDEMLRNKIKAHLKERNWDRYIDNEGTKIGVTITTQKRETLDKSQLKEMLSEEQLIKITKVTSFEKMNIVTPEIRERLKRYVKPDKNDYKQKASDKV